MQSIIAAAGSFQNGSTKTLWTWSAAAGVREVALKSEADTPAIAEKKDAEGNVLQEAQPEKKGRRLGSEQEIKKRCSLDQALEDFLASDRNLVLTLCDPQPDLDRSPVSRSWLKRALYHARKTQKMVVILGGDWHIPPELRDQFRVLELELPTKAELQKYLEDLAGRLKKRNGTETDPAVLPDLARALAGLTFDEAKSVTALGVTRYDGLQPQCIKVALEEKKQIVARAGVLSYEEPGKTMKDVGGLEQFKAWIGKQRGLYSDKAKERGIEPPKGVLVLGVPGTGKSLSARAVAASWRVPLIRLDVGALFGGIVGETESNTRMALTTAKAVAPCVLWIDEIDKSLNPDSGGDNGVSKRLFGSLLTFMQEDNGGVFIFATANKIEALPPEFLRKGRFDEIFFVDLPDAKARQEVFKIHLSDSKTPNVDVSSAVAASSGYVGAEIKSVCKTAKTEALHDGDRDITPTDLVRAIRATVPLSKTSSEQIRGLRAWAASGRAVLAGNSPDDDVENQERSIVEVTDEEI
jgi:SpoVK/Ycf46/Vps4 family AAA+-type ATPase